jgi:hypothetical protein
MVDCGGVEMGVYGFGLSNDEVQQWKAQSMKGDASHFTMACKKWKYAGNQNDRFLEDHVFPTVTNKEGIEVMDLRAFDTEALVNQRVAEKAKVFGQLYLQDTFRFKAGGAPLRILFGLTGGNAMKYSGGYSTANAGLVTIGIGKNEVSEACDLAQVVVSAEWTKKIFEMFLSHLTKYVTGIVGVDVSAEIVDVGDVAERSRYEGVALELIAEAEWSKLREEAKFTLKKDQVQCMEIRPYTGEISKVWAHTGTHMDTGLGDEFGEGDQVVAVDLGGDLEDENWTSWPSLVREESGLLTESGSVGVSEKSLATALKKRMDETRPLSLKISHTIRNRKTHKISVGTSSISAFGGYLDLGSLVPQGGYTIDEKPFKWEVGKEPDLETWETYVRGAASQGGCTPVGNNALVIGATGCVYALSAAKDLATNFRNPVQNNDLLTRDDLIHEINGTEQEDTEQEGLLIEAIKKWCNIEATKKDTEQEAYSYHSLLNISGIVILKVLVEEYMTNKRALFVARPHYWFNGQRSNGQRYKPTWTVGSFIERSHLKFSSPTIFKDGVELKASAGTSSNNILVPEALFTPPPPPPPLGAFHDLLFSTTIESHRLALLRSLFHPPHVLITSIAITARPSL